jgi:hypothetical protein
MMKIDKHKAESIVSEDLKKKYPDIKQLEFTYLKFYELLNEWLLMGWITTKSGNIRIFSYHIDAATGQIKEYDISIVA